MAKNILYANNASTTIATGISNVATSVTLSAGSGVLFPAPTGTDFFRLTFVDAATGFVNEICHATNVTADTLTIVRGQEGTTAKAWLAGDVAANIMTAADMQLVQEYFNAITVSVAGAANITLTDAQAQAQTIILTGLLTGNIQLIFPLQARKYTIVNNSTGAFAVTAIQASGTGVVIPQNGNSYAIYSDAVNINFDAPASDRYADAGGTADAVTASYVGVPQNLVDGYRLTVGIVTPNATTTPTFAPTLNGITQTARTIVKFVANTAVAVDAGDLQGDVDLLYDLPNTRWILASAGGGITLPSADARYPIMPYTYSNLKVSVPGLNSYTQVVTADYAILRNSSGVAHMASAINLTLNANGTTGTPLACMSARAASTWYFRWLWYNATLGLTATLDISSTAPTAPTGYSATDYKMLLPGASRTDASGSTYLIQLETVGRSTRYIVTTGTNTAALPQLINGAQGSVTTPTWVASSIASYVPSTAVTFNGVLWIAGGATPSAMVAPNNSYGAYNNYANPPPLFLFNYYSAESSPFSFLLESSNIYYAGTVNCLVTCYGWED